LELELLYSTLTDYNDTEVQSRSQAGTNTLLCYWEWMSHAFQVPVPPLCCSFRLVADLAWRIVDRVGLGQRHIYKYGTRLFHSPVSLFHFP
jgi:hypothetical protein